METNQPKITEEEQEVLNLENRRSTAESALQETAEAKQKILKDIEEINTQIESGKEMIVKNSEDLAVIKEQIKDEQASYVKEAQKFDDFVKASAIKKAEIENDITLKKDEKETLMSDIEALSAQHEKNKLACADEIADLEAKRDAVIGIIKQHEASSLSMENEISAKKEILENLTNDVTRLSEEKSAIEQAIAPKKSELASQESLIEKNSIVIAQQEGEKETLQKELVSITSQIEQKREEYRLAEKKIFSIQAEKDLLAQKELFIKSQFERAGIKWEQ